MHWPARDFGYCTSKGEKKKVPWPAAEELFSLSSVSEQNRYLGCRQAHFVGKFVQPLIAWNKLFCVCVCFILQSIIAEPSPCLELLVKHVYTRQEHRRTGWGAPLEYLFPHFLTVNKDNRKYMLFCKRKSFIFLHILYGNRSNSRNQYLLHHRWWNSAAVLDCSQGRREVSGVRRFHYLLVSVHDIQVTVKLLTDFFCQLKKITRKMKIQSVSLQYYDPC